VSSLSVASCGCFSAESSARGVVPSLPDPWSSKGLLAGATRARPWNCGGHCAFPLSPFTAALSLWCAGGNLSLLSHFLFSLFFSQKSPPIRRARTPYKHGAVEGAEFSWSSELLRAGVGFHFPRGHKNQSAWFVGVCEEKFIRHGASSPPLASPRFVFNRERFI
jgi:hypothetical protein